MISVQEFQNASEALSQITNPQLETNTKLEQSVKAVIQQVREDGDSALRELGQRFGDTIPETFLLSDTDIQAALNRVPAPTQALLTRAADNIRIFAEAVMQSVQPVSLNRENFQVGLDWKPVERVACYVPGGRYPLPSTALMTSVTAQVAGVREICIVSPQLCDEVIAAGKLTGVQRFYQLGGAQAVAALAFGTESIAPVDMIVGPGNAYVTEAKRQLLGVIGIDMLAGPSEVAIIADANANPHWVAADLLAQAEHDPDARAYLLTDSKTLATGVVKALEEIISSRNKLPSFLTKSNDWGRIMILSSLSDCIEVVNALAPEHLELQVAEPEKLKSQLQHYGALFMGYHTPVPFGDYMAGPNHTLPTARTARFSGGLNPLTFLRPHSWIHASEQSQSLAMDTENFAKLEGLTAHALSASARCKTPISSN